MWKRAGILLSVLAVCAAFQDILLQEPKPEKFKNEVGCYMAEFDRVLPLCSVTNSINNCWSYQCNLVRVYVIGCRPVAASPPLWVVEDKSKLYPFCCPKIAGPENWKYCTDP